MLWATCDQVYSSCINVCKLHSPRQGRWQDTLQLKGLTAWLQVWISVYCMGN